MSGTQQTSLHFNIKESIRFFSGQGVQEILLVELLPHIQIREENSTVFIEGNLLLTGEYIPNNLSLSIEKSLREISGISSVEEVIEREDGVNELKHTFPVNISIPVERVENVNDVAFVINSFDYELYEEDQMFVYADISINGLRKEQNEVLYEEYEIADSEQNVEEVFDISDSEEEFVLSRQEDIPDSRFPEDVSPFSISTEEYEKELEEPLFLAEETVEEKVVTDIPVIFSEEENKEEASEKTATPLQAFQVEVKKEIEAAPLEVHRFAASSLPIYSSLFEKEKETEEVNQPEAKVREEEVTDEVEEKESKSVLASLFQNKNPEQEYSKLKMYFVQKGDSIHDIAKRYSVTVNALQRVNELEDDTLDVGKLLYIPVYNS